ncbi:MAG: DUF924 family protein [Sphingomicrobium sp.]
MTSATDAAPAVLHFWFNEVGTDRWFAKDDALDQEIARRFGKLRDQVIASDAAGWRDDLATLTAAIILVDQFSRNIHRGSAKAFAADPLALDLALSALERGWVALAPEPWRAFQLMPLMHSEDLAVQERSLVEFARLGNPFNLEFARKHQGQIARFGRFPGRNKAMGRLSTEEERALIDTGETF